MSKRRLKEISPGMAIHCKTEDEAKELLEYLHESGYAWISDQSLKDKTIRESFKEKTCYLVNENKKITFGDFGSHKNILGVHAVEYTDLILPELTAEEVLEICHKICREGNDGTGCDECEMKNDCFAVIRSDPKKVVEICAQWKADHEKKAPELEWVDICRIIRVHDTGRKECVEEIPVLRSLSKGFAEYQLKQYIREHEGNYFAVVESVCRTKKSNGN